jgi:hypothetical protein
MFGMIALFMNPIFPIHLQKEIWIVLNLVMVAAFVWHKAAVTPKKVNEPQALESLGNRNS